MNPVDPVEIMARSKFDASFTGDWNDYHPAVHEQLRKVSQIDIAALEAAGWRIVHPEKVTDTMHARAVIGYTSTRSEGRELLHAIKEAIAAAPLHGKG